MLVSSNAIWAWIQSFRIRLAVRRAWSWRPVGLVIITRHQARAIGPDRQVNPLPLRQGRGTALSPAPSGVLAGLADQWLTGGHSGDLVSFRGAGSKAIVLRDEMRPLKTKGAGKSHPAGKNGRLAAQGGPSGRFQALPINPGER